MNITARHFDITPGIKNTLIESFENIESFNLDITKKNLVLTKENNRISLEVIFHIANHNPIVIKKETSDDFYKTVEIVAKLVSSKLIEIKDKHISKKRGSSFDDTFEYDDFNDSDEEEFDNSESDESYSRSDDSDDSDD